MLKSIKSAMSVNCRKNASIARSIDREANTVTGWFSGRFKIPERVRPALDAAMGVAVDWEAYDLEYAVEHDRRYSARAMPPAPAAPPEPAPAPPKTPADPPKIATTAPRRLTAIQPTKMQTLRQKAPAAAPEPKRGFFAAFMAPEGELFT